MAEVIYSKKQITPLLEKFSINPESNTMFIRIINMFAEQTNYQIWAIKAVFGKKASIEDIEAIKSWADANQTHIKLLIKQNIVSYNNSTEFVQLFKEMRGIDMMLAVKSTVEKFNTAQRKMLNDEIAKCKVNNGLEAQSNSAFKSWYELFRKFEGIASSRKGLFIKKASGYSNVATLRKGIEDTLIASYDWEKDDLLGFVERNTPDCKVVYNKDNIVILQIKSFDSSHKLCGNGRTGWCITRENSYFKQYVLDKTGNRQYFFFDFSKKETDELAHIGFTVNNNNGIVNAHSTRNSSMLGEGINYNGKRMNVHQVLKENGVRPSVYLELKPMKNYAWTLESALKFIEAHGDLFAISMNEDNRIIVRCMSRQAMQSLCDHSLINPGNISCGTNDKNYVMLDFNLPREEEKSLIVMNYIKDRYNSYSLGNMWDAYNASIKNEGYLNIIGIPTEKYLQREKIAPTILLHKLIEEKNEKEAVELIAKQGEDFDVNFEFEKQTPIFLAVQNNFFDLFAALINHKKFDYNTVDVFAENIFTSLLYEYLGKTTAENKDKKAIEALENMINIILESEQFNFNIQNLNLDTAVNIACQYAQTTWIAEKLIANPRVNINVVNDFNCSALGCAIYGSNMAAIKLLAQREDFVVREDDKELANTKGVNLNEVLSSVKAVAYAK